MKKKTQYILQMYYGGTKSMDEEGAERIRLMWKKWKYDLEEKRIVYDFGNPFGDERRVISKNGESVSNEFGFGETPPNGYIILLADNIDDAVEEARNCPHLQTGGSVEVREVIEVIWRD